MGDSPRRVYIRQVRDLVRQHFRFFLLFGLAGLALRLFFILQFSMITSDSLLYGDIAKNWLQHGTYGQTMGPEIVPTYIRLPGYPAFLAVVFAVFGIEHYRAALPLQMLADLVTCFVVADVARRLISRRAAKAAFVLAALCPFLANYTAAALTETLEVFFTAWALDFAVIGFENLDAERWRSWTACGISVGAAILLRPDGGLLLIALGTYLTWTAIQRFRSRGNFVPAVKALVIVGVVALAPLVPWTLRNLHTLHRFEPLAPRYANEEEVFVPMGFNRWVKTWIADYVSVEEIDWVVSSAKLDIDNLPLRAFDSDDQEDQTEQLFNEYNETLEITPELDARFGELAKTRIHHAPSRYYVWLPLVRITDMWLRPRTELLPVSSRWWEFDDNPKWIALALIFGTLNLLYVGAAVAGWIRKAFLAPAGMLVLFVLARSLFLGTLENPEPRYTLECYPVVIVLASALFKRRDRPA
jgi:4-amino-4-deoxy-L-arabinose transferase-like glycosyltransferase